MGIEHYLVCKQCGEYIDLHKAYAFSIVIDKSHPPVGCECAETGFNEVVLHGGYWESRGLWFLWSHRGHPNVEIWTDSNDDWWNLEPKLKEVFSHSNDLEIRKRVKTSKD